MGDTGAVHEKRNRFVHAVGVLSSTEEKKKKTNIKGEAHSDAQHLERDMAARMQGKEQLQRETEMEAVKSVTAPNNTRIITI